MILVNMNGPHHGIDAVVCFIHTGMRRENAVHG